MRTILNKGVAWLCAKHLFDWMPDKPFLEMYFWGCFGKRLDLKNPKSFSEKLQWLKLYDRNPLYIKLVDKYEVKRIVGEKIGEEYIIPTLGVWNSFDEINFEILPNRFVLKSTHDSGGIVICKDKDSFNKDKAREKLEASLKQNFYYATREWAYKEVPRRIIAEEYMEDSETQELRDYKFFCFDGVVKALFIASDRQDDTVDTKFDFYDVNFTHLDFRNGHPNANKEIKKPVTFEKMKELAAVLSKGIPQVRVDFYEVDGKIYFGELTFAHWGGMMPFEPEEWDYKFGEWIKLPTKSL